MKYKHIVVEGNIGSGKTTLSKMLSKDNNARLVLEAFAENPFLPKFYKEPKKHAFALELFFMAERYQQLKLIKNQDLFKNQIISDYFFVKSKLFAQTNLNKDEMHLFSRLYEITSSSIPSPDLVIYLYSDINRLQKNIKKRGRDFEQKISDGYLQSIQDKYLDYLRKQNDFPVLLIDVTLVDFVSEKSVYDRIKDILKLHYDNGIYTIDLWCYPYDFIKRKNYQEEFSYLIKYLKNNIIDFDLSDEKKDNIIQYLEKCAIEVSENKEYKKYIKKINNFCEKIYHE